ncbi:MAG: hypothetical protein A3C35_04790 [Omnitrophica bacterium RIFCSPHIGHO2_02_FULL_46_11]|nr:MAG: hypothetical protein A3C35_04790 [Omnitrophica bacterium RIFCSPHIGHO2_02_FULL_46_11]
MRQYLSHCALFAGAVAPALIVGNFDVALRLCARVLSGKNWHLPLNAANTTREDFDILYEYDVLLRKCLGLEVRAR